MTAKDKAYELFEKIWLIEGENGVCEMSHFDAKQCAIIAVDEIIKEVEEFCSISNFWREVKTEIENYKL